MSSVVCFKRRGRPRTILFHESIELPEDWDNSEVSLNVDDDLLGVCSRRIAQQCTYDKKPLGVAVCYGCRHMLWSCVDGAHTFLVSKPSGVSGDEADAPACATAYLRAMPNCVAGFVYTERGKSTKERWYSCGYRCKSQIPPEHHVGNVFDATM